MGRKLDAMWEMAHSSTNINNCCHFHCLAILLPQCKLTFPGVGIFVLAFCLQVCTSKIKSVLNNAPQPESRLALILNRVEIAPKIVQVSK